MFTWVRYAFQQCLQAGKVPAPGPYTAADSELGSGASDDGSVQETAMESDRAATTEPMSEQNSAETGSGQHPVRTHTKSFLAMMTVNAASFQRALADTTGLWLDAVPASLFVALFKTNVEVTSGRRPAEHAGLLLQFLSRERSVLDLDKPLCNGTGQLPEASAQLRADCDAGDGSVTACATEGPAVSASPVMELDLLEQVAAFERAMERHHKTVHMKKRQHVKQFIRVGPLPGGVQ